MLIDTHCHVDAYFKITDVVADAERSQTKVIAVTNRPASFHKLREALRHENFRVAIGIHPLEAGSIANPDLAAFRDALKCTRYVGEVGLDFSGCDKNGRLVQERVFANVCEAIVESPKITTVHSRRAVVRLLHHLTIAQTRPVIFHWFSGTAAELDAILERDHYLSFNMAMLSTVKGRSMLARVPKKRVLIETDGPYAKTSGRSSWPSDTIAIARVVAQVWECSETDVRNLTMENFRRLQGKVFTDQSPA